MGRIESEGNAGAGEPGRNRHEGQGRSRWGPGGAIPGHCGGKAPLPPALSHFSIDSSRRRQRKKTRVGHLCSPWAPSSAAATLNDAITAAPTPSAPAALRAAFQGPSPLLAPLLAPAPAANAPPALAWLDAAASADVASWEEAGRRDAAAAAEVESLPEAEERARRRAACIPLSGERGPALPPPFELGSWL